MAPTTFKEAEVEALLARLSRLGEEIKKLILGQDDAVEGMLTAMLAGGHCLLRGVPGLGKTLMVRTLARAVDMSYHRVQFTPDLMPSDIVGTEILEEDHTTGKRFFKFHKGPIFCQILLADEINRTPPKTQAALLEAMQEGAVTYGGATYPLPQPFFVLATQNPIEQAGTYPLPEAQLDRFLLMIHLDYPQEFDELQIISETTRRWDPKVEAVVDGPQILQAQALVRDVHVSDDLLSYTNRLVRASRPGPHALDYVREWVDWGAGPRAGQAIVLTAKARALLQGRFSATLADLRAMAYPVLRHRILLNFKGEAERMTADGITEKILADVSPPESPLA